MKSREEYLSYKIEKAEESLKAAQLMLENELYADAISRIYYAAFHAATALIRNKNLNPKTHLGAKALFHKEFVFTGIVDEKFGKLYGNLLAKRFEVDYEYFPLVDEEEIPGYIDEVKKFIELVKKEIGVK